MAFHLPKESTLPEATQPRARAGAKHRTPVGLARFVLIFLLVALATYAAIDRLGKLPEVAVSVAEVAQIEGDFTAEGVVEGKEYPLVPEASGRIASVLVTEGQSVRSGQVLMRLDDSDLVAGLDAARAAHAAAAAQLTGARESVRLLGSNLESRVSAAVANLRNAKARQRLLEKGARPEEIDQARHRVEGAQALVDNARKALERAEFLFREGATSRAALELAETRYQTSVADLEAAKDAVNLLQAGPRPEESDAAKALVSAAETELTAAENGRQELNIQRAAARAAESRVAETAAAVRHANAQFGKLQVRAPVAGIVSRVDVEVGSTVAPGQAAITLSTRTDMHIEAEISTEDVPKVSQGMKVAVTSPGFPGKRFEGKIVSLSPTGELKRDAAIRTRILRARITLLEGWSLFRPGMEVDVEGKAVLKKALTVPSDAINFDEGGASVWVVRDGKVTKRQVSIGLTSAISTEILSGLSKGEVVVIRGKESVREGGKIAVAK